MTIPNKTIDSAAGGDVTVRDLSTVRAEWNQTDGSKAPPTLPEAPRSAFTPAEAAPATWPHDAALRAELAPSVTASEAIISEEEFRRAAAGLVTFGDVRTDAPRDPYAGVAAPDIAAPDIAARAYAARAAADLGAFTPAEATAPAPPPVEQRIAAQAGLGRHQLRARILDADDIRRERYDVYKWRLVVEVRGMTGVERRAVIERLTDEPGLTVADLYPDLVISNGYIAGTDEKLFDPGDREILATRSTAIIGALGAAIWRLSGMGEGAAEELGKL